MSGKLLVCCAAAILLAIVIEHPVNGHNMG
jgi:hypothetical protein